VAAVLDGLVNPREPLGLLAEHKTAVTGHEPLQVVPVLAHADRVVHVLQHDVGIVAFLLEKGEVARSAHGGHVLFKIRILYRAINPFFYAWYDASLMKQYDHVCS